MHSLTTGKNLEDEDFYLQKDGPLLHYHSKVKNYIGENKTNK